MTGTRDPQQDGTIQAMLGDSGLESAAELRSALEQLRAVVPDAAPAPRADLAALLAAGTAGATGLAAAPDAATTTALPTVAFAKNDADESLPAGVTSLAGRRGRKRRLAIVGGAVVGAMTLGAGAVAASSEDFRHSVSHTVGVIFQTPGHGTPAPEHVQPSPSSVPALPAPAATPGHGTSGTPGADQSGASTRTSSSTPGATAAGHAPPATPPAVGRDGILPTPGQRPGAPGLPGSPGLPGGGGNAGKDLPRVPGHITPTLPGAVPTKAPGQP